MENELSNTNKDTQEDFWKKGVFSTFKGKKNLNISYAHFKHSSTAPVIVISPGRCESYLKYQETVFELCRSGYNVFLIDHRGQGLSDRMLTNPYKGYVENFDDYADDLHYFITAIVIPNSNNTFPYLLAHSMGCAITIRMLQLYPNVLKKAVLLSPMIAINTGPLPHFIAHGIVRALEKINQKLSKEPWYFIGQTDYKIRKFDKNLLTHCKKRFQDFVDLYQNNKDIQLGGVTIKWLYEAFKTEQAIFSNLDNIQTPLALFQGSEDKIVDNQKQDKFCSLLHSVSPQIITPKPIVIDGAYHELLFEVTSLRQETISQIDQFFLAKS